MVPPLTVFNLVARTFADNDAGCARPAGGPAGVLLLGAVATPFSSEEVQLEMPPMAINESTMTVRAARIGVQNRWL